MKSLLPACLWIVTCLVSIAAVGFRPSAETALAESTGAGAEPAAAVGGAASPEAPEPSARTQVARLEATLLDIMKRADQLGFEGRLAVITPVVDETFDLEFMAQTSIGRIWSDLTPELKSRWIDCFSRYTRTKFADQFDRYSGQEFVLLGERPASHETLIVMSSVDRSGQPPVRLDFRVHRTDEGWRIIDVYGRGRVSELALRRSEYAPVLKRGGIEGLIESVDELSTRTGGKTASQDARR